MVDDAEIQRSENLARVINKPTKHPEPVLVSDKPWEGDRAQAWGSVILEPDGLFRMWYFAFNTSVPRSPIDCGGYCYAESRDGIYWEKPNLGLFEFRGNKNNNLFYSFAPDGKNQVEVSLARRRLGLPAIDQQGKQIGILNNADGLTVVRDDDEPDPDKRYKLFANMQDHAMQAAHNKVRYPDITAAQVLEAYAVFGQYMDTSPDGIHWTRKPQRFTDSVGDYMMVLRDHRNNRWWLNDRSRAARGARNASLRISADLTNWSASEIYFDHDEENSFGSQFQWHGGMTPFNYGNMNLGLLERWPMIDMDGSCELICNRDGGPWRRVQPGTSFLAVGSAGAFDRVQAYPTHNPPLRLGNKLYIFYTGSGARRDLGCGTPMSMGLATLDVDRFVALGTYESPVPGLLVTKPVKVAAGQLLLNVEMMD